MSLYMGNNGPAPCVYVAWVALVPYIKNTQIYACPSNATALDFPTAMSVIGMPPPCPGSPDLKYISYFPNFALFDWGNPSNFFGPNDRPVKRMAELEYPADTSVFYDSVGTFPDAYFGMMDEPIQARHQNLLNATYADSHAKVVHAKPWLDNSNNPITGHTIDGQAIKYYKVTDAGPYQEKPEMRGVPFKNADGTWGLRY